MCNLFKTVPHLQLQCLVAHYVGHLAKVSEHTDVFREPGGKNPQTQTQLGTMLMYSGNLGATDKKIQKTQFGASDEEDFKVIGKHFNAQLGTGTNSDDLKPRDEEQTLQHTIQIKRTHEQTEEECKTLFEK